MHQSFYIAALAAIVVSAPAIAADNSGTAGGASNSGPGVQGPADTRTGPSIKQPDNSSATSGTSAGTGEQTGPGAGTSPSQDASGVAGAPGNKNGPAAKEPSK